MSDPLAGHTESSDRVYLAGGHNAVEMPLRGRADVTDTLFAEVLSAVTGTGRPVLLRGGPGMGKTRVLAEVLAFAHGHRWRTLTVTPDVDSSAVPLGALVEAARRSQPPLITDADLQPVLSGSEPQYWVTRVLADALERASADAGGAVVIVDDLQWLDVASLTVLLTLVRATEDQPVAWVFATRPGRYRPAHTRAVTRLAADGLSLDLPALAPDAVREIAADIAGGRPGPHLEEALHRTASIPLLVVELVRGLREENLLRATGGVVDAVGSGVPARFGASSRERVDHLSADALHLIQVASLFGRTFDLRLVLDAAARTAADSAAAFHELLTGDFLMEDGDAVSFVHDTIREAAEASIPTPLRRPMLRDVVRLRLAAGEPASAVAAALTEIADPGDTDSFDLIRRAAEQLAASDSAQAADLAEAALNLARHVPRLAQDAAELLPYLWADGRHAEADAAAAELAPYLSAQARARSLLAIARRQTESSFDQAIATCDAALAMSGIDRSTRAELLAVRALNCANKADFTELVRTLALAREVADPDVDHLALATVDATDSVYAFNSGRFDDAVHLIEAATERASAAGLDPARWVPEGLWAAFLYNSMGAPDYALTLVDAGLSAARRARAVVAEAYWMMIRARVLYDLGRLDDARLQAEAVLALAEELGLGDFANATAGIVLFRVSLHTGDGQTRARSHPIVVELAAGPGVTKAGRWMLTLDAIDRGQWADAVDLAELARASLDEPVPAMTTPSDFSDDLTLLDLALRTDDAATVAAVISRAGTRHRQNPSSAFSEAIALAVRGRAEGDREAIERAASILRGLPRPLVLARVLEQCDLVDGDDEHAVAFLEEALSVYESHGAVRDASRVLQALRARGVRRRPRAHGAPQLLSAREQQVLEHLMAGATTQQVADALFMSPHTVVSHIRHIYAKAGVNSRAGLREWDAGRRSRAAAPQ